MQDFAEIEFVIPVFTPDAIFKYRPDIVMILPWNLEDELRNLLKPIST